MGRLHGNALIGYLVFLGIVLIVYLIKQAFKDV